MRIAVFASGSGSNFAAILQAIREDWLTDTEVALLVCDKPGAHVIDRADAYGVPTFVFQPKQYADKAEFEKEILARLREAGVELIVLAGYMRLIGETLLQAYGGRIINIHPSLLPSFAGKDAIGQAFRYGVKITGITVHFVDEGMDTGPIIAQCALPIHEDDTEQSLAERIHEEEHILLPQVIQAIVNRTVRIESRKVTII
ncbi:phosphoribosylglycinamide formyltransferase [Aneurinibacillus terranovensis]|uniref:phosphoribosylglycinamide formyltransferase n=1 Tax=Aneurinibacillus terranovensis TaxID=278991 RepID=UPI0003FBF281|nr:phosphoribosylglycinamide formyltransferase [Aneurinibacillus terranovensis]